MIGRAAPMDNSLLNIATMPEALTRDVGLLPRPARVEKPKPKVTQEQAGLILLPTFAAAPAPEVTAMPETPASVDPVFVAQVDGALADLGRRADRYGVTVALRSELSG